MVRLSPGDIARFDVLFDALTYDFEQAISKQKKSGVDQNYANCGMALLAIARNGLRLSVADLAQQKLKKNIRGQVGFKPAKLSGIGCACLSECPSLLYCGPVHVPALRVTTLSPCL